MDKDPTHVQQKNLPKNNKVDDIKPKANQQKDTQASKLANNNYKNTNVSATKVSKRAIWDCGSSLYDSFELNSFQKQLDSAIISSSRTFSMPRRLPSDDIRLGEAATRLPRPPPPSSATDHKKPPKKLSRSFRKLLGSVFRTSRSNALKSEYGDGPDPWFMDHSPAHPEKNIIKEGDDGGKYYVVYEKPNGLSTIPEVPEVGLSPEIGSLVRKTMSDRFKAAALGIYCT